MGPQRKRNNPKKRTLGRKEQGGRSGEREVGAHPLPDPREGDRHGKESDLADLLQTYAGAVQRREIQAVRLSA